MLEGTYELTKVEGDFIFDCSSLDSNEIKYANNPSVTISEKYSQKIKEHFINKGHNAFSIVLIDETFTIPDLYININDDMTLLVGCIQETNKLTCTLSEEFLEKY